MTTSIPKNPIPSLMDVDFHGFLYTRMAGLIVAMVAMVAMVDTAGRSVTVETGMEVLQCHNLGEEDAVKGLGQMNQRGFAGSKSC